MRRAIPCLLLACAGCGTSSSRPASDGGADTFVPDAAGVEGGSFLESGTPGDAASLFDAGDAGAPALHPVMGDFLGINAFIVNQVPDLVKIGNVREYHDWIWIAGNGASPAYPNNQDTFSLFDGSWDWDGYYAGLKAAGVFGYPVVQGTIAQVNDGGAPPASGDPTLPASYAAHADDLFQVAARYGSTQVPATQLKLAAGQTAVSGLGTVPYVEDNNEPDLGGFTSAQYVAMASADYDGDQQRMGTTVGIKNADPNMRMAMAGLSGPYGGGGFAAWEQGIEKWLDDMRAWSASHRGGSFPADVVNLHHYDFGPNNVPVSPEDDGVKDTLAKLVAYRDANLPGKEIWITEFGYDTNTSSVLGAPAIGSSSPEIVQAQWLVRSYLAVVAAGFDRAFLYLSADQCKNGSDSTQFATAGLLSNYGEDSTEGFKPSFYFVATLRARLGALAWLGEQASGNANVLVYKFKNPAGASGAYVVWAPTSNATVVSGYVLAVGGASSATQVLLADQQPTGIASTLAPAAGTVTIDVTETPTLVLVDAIQ